MRFSDLKKPLDSIMISHFYKKINIKQIFIICILCTLLPSVVIQAVDLESNLELDYRGSDCISLLTIRDYTVLDDRNLLIWSSSKRAYFVRLFRRAWELKSSFQIGTLSRDNWLCPYGGDALVFNSIGRGQNKVSIASIQKINRDEADWLLVRFGKKDPAIEQTPVPKSLEGAEVEELD